jgi:hypothetical protein
VQTTSRWGVQQQRAPQVTPQGVVPRAVRSSDVEYTPFTPFTPAVSAYHVPNPPSTPTYSHSAAPAGSPSEPSSAPGPMHGPVTVDVQAASRMSDEKSKRNSGASARFRQRRKEKEDESSQVIRKLEQEIQDAIKDRDLYRSQRDSYLEILSQAQTHAPFQPSPEQSLPWGSGNRKRGACQNCRESAVSRSRCQIS